MTGSKVRQGEIMRNITLAATQMACDWDIEANIGRAEALLRELAARHPRPFIRQLAAFELAHTEIRRICEPLPAMLDPRSFVVSEASSTLH